MSTSSFLFKDIEIEHKIKKNLKNSYISINDNGTVLLKTPQVDEKFINKLLHLKEKWIRQKLNQLKSIPTITINKEKEILLFGEVHSIESKEANYLRKKLNKIKTSSSQKTTKAYNDFYKFYAQEYINIRVNYFSTIMKLNYKEIKYRKMKSRWGSCSSTKILTFNTELMKIKKELIDYVVVHELSHLKEMNHSAKFHSLVDSYLPNSKKLRQELRNTKLITL